MSRVEVAVVGAGVTGLAVARELTTRGVSVAVVERAGIASGASGVQRGDVRQQWGTRVACGLARESFAFWRQANECCRSCTSAMGADQEAIWAAPNISSWMSPRGLHALGGAGNDRFRRDPHRRRTQ
jgi:glycine/D-amino acid oxidase-like deaminating enzyme